MVVMCYKSPRSNYIGDLLDCQHFIWILVTYFKASVLAYLNTNFVMFCCDLHKSCRISCLAHDTKIFLKTLVNWMIRRWIFILVSATLNLKFFLRSCHFEVFLSWLIQSFQLKKPNINNNWWKKVITEKRIFLSISQNILLDNCSFFV